MEYRRKCNVCGKIWCYTDQDLQDNKAAKTSSSLAAIAGIGGALSGNLLTMHVTNSAMNSAPKVIDYSRCPECNSTVTTLLEDKSIANEISAATMDLDYSQAKILLGEKYVERVKKNLPDSNFDMAKHIEARLSDDEEPLFCVGINFSNANEPINPKTRRCCVFTNKKRAWYCIGTYIKLSIDYTVGCVEFNGIPNIKREDEGIRKVTTGKVNFLKITVSDDSNNVLVFEGVQEVMEKIQQGLENVLEEWKVEKNIPLKQKSTNEPPTASTTTAFSVADEIRKFKELLDMGILTQEEFDAKKKQLLGL